MLQPKPGTYQIHPQTIISYDGHDAKDSAQTLADGIEHIMGYQLEVHQGCDGDIHLHSGNENNPIIFQLSIDQDKVYIHADSDRGLIQGILSFQQILSSSSFHMSAQNNSWEVPCLDLHVSPL